MEVFKKRYDMNCFYLMTNDVKDKDLVITNKIADYLREHGKTCVIQVQSEPQGEWQYYSAKDEQEGLEADCIIVLGGDGTLLRAARDVVDKGTPLCGINLGNLGYLAEIDAILMYPALDSLMNDEYEIEKRMMLTGSVYRGEKLLASDVALNDIVISRERPQRVVHFHNYVNGEFLNAYDADGIIVSTPTGSTGYSLSAGGPIISPSASLLLLTPLAAHALNTRSIVFDCDDEITVEIGTGRFEAVEKGSASFDGANVVELVTGDRVVIKKSKKDTRIVKISNTNFLEVLRNKMNS